MKKAKLECPLISCQLEDVDENYCKLCEIEDYYFKKNNNLHNLQNKLLIILTVLIGIALSMLSMGIWMTW